MRVVDVIIRGEDVALIGHANMDKFSIVCLH